MIYVGPNGRDDEDTDAEHPPVYLPNLNSGDNRGMMANALRGSTADCSGEQVWDSSNIENGTVLYFFCHFPDL